MVKNLSAIAGDTGLILGPGRFYVRRGSKLNAPTTKPRHLESVLCNKRSFLNEKPGHHKEEQPLLTTTRESLHAATKTQCNQKKPKTKTPKKYPPTRKSLAVQAFIAEGAG